MYSYCYVRYILGNFFFVLFCVLFVCICVLYCTVLYCTVLYCTVLYCTVLYCTVLYCTVPYCTVLLSPGSTHLQLTNIYHLRSSSTDVYSLEKA